MVDASIRELQIPAEAKKRDEVKVGIGMNNDHRATGRAGRDHALALASLTADILDISGLGFRGLSGNKLGEVQTAGACVFKKRWVGGRGVVQSDGCPWNSPGMSDFLRGWPAQ